MINFSSITLHLPTSSSTPREMCFGALRAKLLLQQAWVLALDWDELLTNELQEAWRQWFGELVMLPETKIPRCLKTAPMVTNMEIHSLSDASEKAYSAAVYA